MNFIRSNHNNTSWLPRSVCSVCNNINSIYDPCFPLKKTPCLRAYYCHQRAYYKRTHERNQTERNTQSLTITIINVKVTLTTSHCVCHVCVSCAITQTILFAGVMATFKSQWAVIEPPPLMLIDAYSQNGRNRGRRLYYNVSFTLSIFSENH